MLERVGLGAEGRPARRVALLRRSAPPRDRARTRHAAKTASARRAFRRPRHQRDRAARRADPRVARVGGPYDPAGGTSPARVHGAGHARHRDGFRRGDRGRQSGRDHKEPARHQGLYRRQRWRTPVPLLELQRLTVHYGKALAIDALDLHVDAGELVCVLGPNGAGKIDAAESRLRRHRLDRRRDLRRPLACRPAGAQGRRPRHLPLPGRAAALPGTHRAQEPRTRRLSAQRSREDRRRSAGSVPAVPDPEGARETAGEHAVGRRAADGGDRPRADGRAETPAAR